MIHQTHINHYSLPELATAIGDLRYDTLAEFLDLLAAKIAADGEKDGSRGRKQLASSLAASSEKLSQSARDIEHAWKICEPYMK